jgi:hypothetical protein
MPIVRRKLDANTVYPTNLRYNSDTDTVQSNVNGDWVDNPEADPRKQTSFPPRITDNSACDAAQSVTDALHGQIDGILVAIDNASTLFTIAGIILSIFTFGAYAIFVSLALGIGDQMVGFGSTAISAALTEPVYETFKCILYCQFSTTGRLKPGGLPIAISDINGQIGGIGATILNAMLLLAGEGGLNNIASLGTVTGDCSECDPCGPPCADNYTVQFGTLVGTFDGYIRVTSEVVGSTSELSLLAPDADTCCKLLDVRVLTEDIDPIKYHILCHNAIVEGNIVAGWTLEGCYNYLSSQLSIGDTREYTVEFLFADC